MEKNLRLYPVFHVARAGFFWLPVFFLYFSSKVGAADALRLQSLYYVLFVVLEVPSGYVSDRVGRKAALVVSSLAGVAGGAVLATSDTFLGLAIGQALLACWHAFFSGSDVALLADTLRALGREQELGHREAVAEAWGRFAVGVAALVGGVVGARALALPYAAFAASAALALVVVALFTEPVRERAPAPLAQSRVVVAHLKTPALLWLAIFYVGMLVVHHVPYELFQPYLDLLTEDRWGAAASTPLVAGVVMAVNSWIAALGARFSIRLAERLGAATVLLAAAAAQVALILSMGAFLHPVVGALIAFRSLAPGVIGPLYSQLLQARLASSERATFFSLLSLAGRTLHGGLMLVASFFLDVAHVDWASMRPVLLIAGAGALAFVTALALTARRARL